MLPYIGQIVTNIISNDQDWRYKHAGISSFTQVSEYVEEAAEIKETF
jgi:hypothetical protein